MLKLDLNQLADAVREADPFELPEMNKGTVYLFNNIYVHLAAGKEIRLSNLDFNAFDSEDLNTLSSLCNDVIMQNSRKAFDFVNTLRKIAPMSKATAYV